MRNFPKILIMFILMFLFFKGSGFCEEDVRKVDDRQNVNNPKEASPVEQVDLPNSDFEIKLKSRRFIPPEDISSAIEFHIRPSPHRRIHVLMQFKDIPNIAQREILKNAGVNMLNYIPQKAWFVSVPQEITQAQLINANVRWIGPILPEDKIFLPILNRGVAPWAVNPDGTVNLEASFFKDVSLDDARQLMVGMGAIIKEESAVSHHLTITVSADKIMDIANQDIVRWIIEERPPKIPLNDGSRANVGANAIQTTPYNLSGSGVDVGIWDGGDVDSTHDDFGARVTIVDGAGVGDHATHVAGTMGGDGTLSSSNGGTAYQWKGMAPQMDIISYLWDNNITDHQGAISTYGIEISQNSWGYQITNPAYYGYYGWDAPEYDDIVTSLYNKKISVVFAAGNDRTASRTYDTIGPPSTAKNIICVGAINSDNDSMTTFSGWGPMNDGRIKPDVVAPGDELGGEGYIKSTLPGDTYGGPGWYGTSMAAPAVSGCASLIIQDFRSLYAGLDPLPSTVKALLQHEAKDLGNIGPDYSYGYGDIQIQDSIDKLRTKSLLEDEISHNNLDTYSFYVPEGSTKVKITLVWDDEPATEGASVTLVNDLDLIVTDPNDVRYYPWTLNPSSPSLPAVKTQEDHTNNVEQVEASGSITTGNWTIKVFGKNVPYAPQKYSLIFTPNYIGNNVIGKIYKDSGYSQEEKFFDRTETVYIEAYVASSGSPLTGASVAATLKLSNGSTVATVNLVDMAGGYYRNSWDSTGQTPDVYLVDINVASPSLNTKEYFHLYPQSGISSYKLDYDEDENKDYILENKHLIAIYDGRLQTDKALLYLYQKDTNVGFNFAEISDNDTKGRTEVTTTNMRDIKFYSFSFLEGENLTQANLGMKTDLTKAIGGVQSCMLDDDDTGTTNNTKGCRIKADFNAATTGQLEFWARCRAQTNKDSFDIMLENSAGTVGPDVYFFNGNIGYYDGSTHTIMAYTPDQWYHFKVVFNSSTDKMDIYIDDMVTPKATNVNFWNPLTGISKIDMDTGQWLSGTPSKDLFDPLVYVDDIDIYSGATQLLTEDFEDDTAGSNPGAPWTVTESSIKTNVEISNTVYHETRITTTFDLSTQMKTEDVDYLVYKLSGFDANIDNISDIFSSISGSLGSSVNDDRYHIGDGTDYPINYLAPGTWTNFSALTNQQKFVAIYDNSLANDAVNNNVISLVYFPNAQTVNFQDVGLWYETGKEALRIRYNTAGAFTTNQAEYILAFTQGSYTIINQWMSTIAGGVYPTPNFMTPPFILSVSVNPNTWPIGIIGKGQIAQSTEANDITVTNTGSVNETFTLNITLDGSSWLPGMSAGVDTYVMWGLFCGATDAPGTSLFKSDDIILAGSATKATDVLFGDPLLTKNGVNIAPSYFVDLWFQFQAPTSTADTSQQTIIVTVGAETP